MRGSARQVLSPRSASTAALLTGLLYWLAFPGVSVWPLAFVAFVPLLVALRGQTPRRALWLGWLTGIVMNLAGFSWIFGTLRTFGGLPAVVALGLTLLLCLYQGGRLALMGWLYARGVQRGWSHAGMALGAFVASEVGFPLIFPWYFGATVYRVPVLTQLAEIGGPILVGAVLVGANLVIEELLQARDRPMHRAVVFAGTGALAGAALFGVVRLRQVDATTRAAESMRVGIVQGNLGLVAKRTRALDGLRIHQRMTAEWVPPRPDLVVWSESAVNLAVPEEGYATRYQASVTQALGVPVIFGGVIVRGSPAVPTYFNSALSSDARGVITGRYDKQHLLPFGEWLPLADRFPVLRSWSPQSGRFSPGTTLAPLPFSTATGPHVASVFICYEDILPAFVNAAVRQAHPDLLVNLTNDAWFGRSAEPDEHLALATFRAIEHRRYLVRAANSGISAIVDPVGRLVTHSQPFRAERLDAVIHLVHGRTLYEQTGDLPAWLCACAVLLGAFRHCARRPGRRPSVA